MTSAAPTLRSEIDAVVELLETGWNQRDASRFASAFTDTHDYVAVGGRLTLDQSRATNAAVHERIWKELYAEGCTITLELLKVDQLTEQVCTAVISNREALVRNGTAQSRASIITAVLVRDDRGWRISQFSNNQSPAAIEGR